MYEFWYEYVKSRYGEKTKLCYMDTESLAVSIKADDLYEYITEDVETRFDILNYDFERPLAKEQNKKKQSCRLNKG